MQKSKMIRRGDRKELVKIVINSLLSEIDSAKYFNLISDELYQYYKIKVVEFSSNLFSNYPDNEYSLDFNSEEWTKIHLFIDEMFALDFIRDHTRKNIHLILNEVKL